MGYDDDILDYINKNILGFRFTLHELLDHLSILSWVSLMSHKCGIGRKIVNIEERPFVQLPSGRKVKITIKIEEIDD
jgi:hypothetical protein